MLFSRVCTYALRALTHLAAHGEGRAVQVKEIAEAENIPRHFLAKILNQLTYKGLVKAMRGPGGGFVLAIPADRLFVRDVLEAIDGMDTIRGQCVLGLRECRDDAPCPMHDAWKGFRETFLSTVGAVSMSAMAETMARKRRTPARRA